MAARLEGRDFDVLVEVGPGKGALTGFLAGMKKGRLVLIEIDSVLAAELAERFKGVATVRNEDFLETDLTEFEGKKICYAGNLPYHCAVPILEKVLFSRGWTAAQFMFQKEVAERICARPGDSNHSYLSVLCAFASKRRKVMDVKRRNFSPVPDVDSSLVLFERAEPLLPAGETRRFMNFVKSAFSHRRKTLVNSLFLSLGAGREETRRRLASMGLAEEIRPQDAGVREYLALYGKPLP